MNDSQRNRFEKSKSNRRNAGFTDEERDKMSLLLGWALWIHIDIFSLIKQHTWWSYMFKAQEKNVGWRMSYFIVSQRLVPYLEEADIHHHIMGSDHCPVMLKINI